MKQKKNKKNIRSPPPPTQNNFGQHHQLIHKHTHAHTHNKATWWKQRGQATTKIIRSPPTQNNFGQHHQLIHTHTHAHTHTHKTAWTSEGFHGAVFDSKPTTQLNKYYKIKFPIGKTNKHTGQHNINKIPRQFIPKSCSVAKESISPLLNWHSSSTQPCMEVSSTWLLREAGGRLNTQSGVKIIILKPQVWII